MANMKLPDVPAKINREDLVAALDLLGIPSKQTLSLHLQPDEATAVIHYLDENGGRRLSPTGDGYQKATLTIPIA